jgi:hypothetical protein
MLTPDHGRAGRTRVRDLPHFSRSHSNGATAHVAATVSGWAAGVGTVNTFVSAGEFTTQSDARRAADDKAHPYCIDEDCGRWGMTKTPRGHDDAPPRR